jgi:hypothetical protein
LDVRVPNIIYVVLPVELLLTAPVKYKWPPVNPIVPFTYNWYVSEASFPIPTFPYNFVVPTTYN